MLLWVLVGYRVLFEDFTPKVRSRALFWDFAVKGLADFLGSLLKMSSVYGLAVQCTHGKFQTSTPFFSGSPNNGDGLCNGRTPCLEIPLRRFIGSYDYYKKEH